MKGIRLHLLLCGALAVVQPALGAAPRPAIGTAVGNGPIWIDGVTLPSGAVFYSGDRISTTSTEASLYLAKGEELTFGPATAAQVTSIPAGFFVQLESGTIAAFDGRDSRTVISAGGITIESQQTSGSYEVAFSGSKLRVATRRGMTLVTGANRKVEVPAGSLMRTTVLGGSSSRKAGKLLLITVIAAAAAAGTILGVAAAAPSPACVSSSQLNCP